MVSLQSLASSYLPNRKPTTSSRDRPHAQLAAQRSTRVDVTHSRPTLSSGPATTSQDRLFYPGRSDSGTSTTITSVLNPKRSNSFTHNQRQRTSRSGSGTDHQHELGAMIDATAPKARRDRTFIGSECAACEEPLEHTLRGERILQLSCGHVSHEACFYEYIKEFESQECPTCSAPLGLDTTRGVNIDFAKINSLAKAVESAPSRPEVAELRGAPSLKQQSLDQRSSYSYNSPRELAGGNHWGAPPRQSTRQAPPQSDYHAYHELENKRTRHLDPYGQHIRNDSGTTGENQANEYEDQHQQSVRRHDYDAQSMDVSVGNSRPQNKNPIPAPLVSVRSEFPTLTRSSQPQSLTCLVTVEVQDGKWRPDPEDVKGVVAAATPALPQETLSPKASVRSQPAQLDFARDPPAVLQRVTDELQHKVDNWHGLDFSRFGKLILHGPIRVGKDRASWQDLDCYLFTEMLICVKEKKPHQSPYLDSASHQTAKSRCTLKGSILIRKHLKQVDVTEEQSILTLSLSVAELPYFHLLFSDPTQLDSWRRALLNINNLAAFDAEEDLDSAGTDEEEHTNSSKQGRRASSLQSSQGAGRSQNTAPTDYASTPRTDIHASRPIASLHVPLDIVVVVPVSSSMQGLKISLLRDVLRFLVANLGDSDRLGVVTFGSSAGGVPVAGLTAKTWSGWTKVLESVKPLGQKSLRADVVEGANMAVDLLMQRKQSNPLASILLISDSATSDSESVDFVVSRAEAAKISIHSFGLGLTHKPDTMIDLSTRTKAVYTYVKDWMMLRECIAGCLGSLQSISHQNVRLKLRLPEGSTATFVKINGALQVIKRAAGRDAEACLGDLRFGDKRDVLVQLAISPDTTAPEAVTSDPWDTIVSGLEALGGSVDGDDARAMSIEEVPLIQADLSWGDVLRTGSTAQLPRPSLLAISMLPAPAAGSRHSFNPPIPPHPSVVQRRMELLASDMLTRALALVSRNQADRANNLLVETRSILKGLGKGGGLPGPPNPPPTTRLPPTPSLSQGNGSEQSSPQIGGLIDRGSPISSSGADVTSAPTPPKADPSSTVDAGAVLTRTISHGTTSIPSSSSSRPTIDPTIIAALDAELEAALEWITHPAVFSRDSRKAVLQAVGVISSQRGFTFRTAVETLWAQRIPGVNRVSEASREWRDNAEEGITEER